MTPPLLFWHTYDHYGYAVVAVLGTIAAVGLIHAWQTRSPWGVWARSLTGVVPPFINIIGTLFALTLAFLANDTWSARDQASSAVFREADALRSLVTLSDTLAEPLRGQLRQALGDYGRASHDEWPRLARREADARVSDRADALLRLVASRELSAAAPGDVRAVMLRKVGELRDDRGRRIGLSQTHVSPLKWLGMAFLGFVTLLSVALVHADQPRAALVAMLLFALAAAPTAAIVLIQGNPFEPPAAVSPAPIAAAVAG